MENGKGPVFYAHTLSFYLPALFIDATCAILYLNKKALPSCLFPGWRTPKMRKHLGALLLLIPSLS